jgi:hypothetical protein
MLELRPRDGILKVHKQQLLERLMIGIVTVIYATRSPKVADSVVVNASVLNKVLNVQPESDPVISSARTARASREVQYDAQQRKAARARAIKRRQQQTRCSR